jgi:hypothetical protein
MQRIWHHLVPMQHDPQGVGRVASAAPPDLSQPSKTTEAESSVATEIGGPKGPEPTRFGDWEKNGRCIDF